VTSQPSRISKPLVTIRFTLLKTTQKSAKELTILQEQMHHTIHSSAFDKTEDKEIQVKQAYPLSSVTKILTPLKSVR
jgi:copper homeostasis protein CutC